MRTVLIENAAGGGQMIESDVVENYPGIFDISGYELSQKFLEHARQIVLSAADGCTAALAAAHWVETKRAFEH